MNTTRECDKPGLMCNVMVNDVFKDVGDGSRKSLFADDGAIWKRGRSVNCVMGQMQQALSKVEKWAGR